MAAGQPISHGLATSFFQQLEIVHSNWVSESRSNHSSLIDRISEFYLSLKIIRVSAKDEILPKEFSHYRETLLSWTGSITNTEHDVVKFKLIKTIDLIDSINIISPEKCISTTLISIIALKRVRLKSLKERFEYNREFIKRNYSNISDFISDTNYALRRKEEEDIFKALIILLERSSIEHRYDLIREIKSLSEEFISYSKITGANFHFDSDILSTHEGILSGFRDVDVLIEKACEALDFSILTVHCFP